VRLSIIIPTYNRAEILLKSLSLIEIQINESVDEVLVVDDGSIKNQKLLVAKSGYLDRKWLRIIDGKNRGPAHARNTAIRSAKGKILLFLNDDSYIGEKYIDRHLAFHEENQAVNVGMVGLTVNHPDTVDIKAMKWLVGQSGLHFNYKFLNNGEVKQIPWYYLWTCNLSLKRKFIIENKLYFDSSFPTAAWEDIEFAYRAKLKKMILFFDSRAIVEHFHELGFYDLKSRFVSHGRGLWHLQNKLPTNFLPFLVKSRWGLVILGVMSSWPARLTGYVLEKIISRLNMYPNWVMQWLVIKWKSNGYQIETKRMSCLRQN
jgi:glycosyltransferase involved in cell wall biosynthesis